MNEGPSKSDPAQGPAHGKQTSPQSTGALRELDVRALLAGAREIVLRLDGEPYRLRITARDKLILTK